MGMVEQVVAFEAELQFRPLADLCFLRKVNVEVHEARTVEVITADVSGSAKIRNCESIWVGEVVFQSRAASKLNVCSSRERISHLVTPSRDTRPLAVTRTADFERMSRLNRGDPG